MRGHTAVCALLLDNGSDIHSKDDVSDTDKDIYHIYMMQYHIKLPTYIHTYILRINKK